MNNAGKSNSVKALAIALPKWVWTISAFITSVFRARRAQSWPFLLTFLCQDKKRKSGFKGVKPLPWMFRPQLIATLYIQNHTDSEIRASGALICVISVLFPPPELSEGCPLIILQWLYKFFTPFRMTELFLVSSLEYHSLCASFAPSAV